MNICNCQNAFWIRDEWYRNIYYNPTICITGSKLAAGYDLHSAYDYEIPPHGKVIAKTDIQICVPDGTYGRIAPRSGLAAKNFIDIGAGVVDQDYR